jgi:hypothetical protein
MRYVEIRGRFALSARAVEDTESDASMKVKAKSKPDFHVIPNQ